MCILAAPASLGALLPSLFTSIRTSVACRSTALLRCQSCTRQCCSLWLTYATSCSPQAVVPYLRQELVTPRRHHRRPVLQRPVWQPQTAQHLSAVTSSANRSGMPDLTTGRAVGRTDRALARLQALLWRQRRSVTQPGLGWKHATHKRGRTADQLPKRHRRQQLQGSLGQLEGGSQVQRAVVLKCRTASSGSLRCGRQRRQGLGQQTTARHRRVAVQVQARPLLHITAHTPLVTSLC